MSAIIIEIAPQCEPVSLVEAKSFIHVTSTKDDSLLATLIQSAREYCEMFTRRSFINKGYAQFLDSFPYYTDTVMSQQAYPAGYYSLPRYSTTLWNYSQMIKLFFSPLAQAAPTIKYLGSPLGRPAAFSTLTGTFDMSDAAADFLADNKSEPARFFPKAGLYWPAVMYVPNAVELHYVAGYNNDAAIKTAVDAFKNNSPAPTAQQASDYEAGLRRADVPGQVKTAMLMCVAHWYDNRWGVMSEVLKKVPLGIDTLLWSLRVFDQAPTRG